VASRSNALSNAVTCTAGSSTIPGDARAWPEKLIAKLPAARERYENEVSTGAMQNPHTWGEGGPETEVLSSALSSVSVPSRSVLGVRSASSPAGLLRGSSATEYFSIASPTKEATEVEAGKENKAPRRSQVGNKERGNDLCAHRACETSS